MEDLFSLLKTIHSSIETRNDLLIIRAEVFNSIQPLKKIAFDTRRINQGNDINPRRNIQHYHRSDPFITKTSAETIKTLFKLKVAVDGIKEDYREDREWGDSNARILSQALDRTLRVDQKDMDFFQPQLDYTNEMLYLRYRLREEDINRFSEKELRGIVLERDEKLAHRDIFANYQPIVKTTQKIEENLIEKLIGTVKASKDNKNISRTVSITINDKIEE